MKILVAVDGTKYSREAVLWAVKIAKKEKDAKIIALYVERQLSREDYLLSDDEIDLKIEKKANDIFVKSFEDIDIEGVEVERIVERGSPASKILDVSDREDVDLIVVGNRSRSGISNFFLGSVSDKVFTYSVRPVLVVKTREKEPEIETVAIT
ncbi:Nucleotide-binding universal stress protein, UspA family [Thermodesulfobium acidiphilum]|uniref:Nucleotide-binding universal stress protein, UspA family n=1 Tax=Thermodesulfobium acidiphilum TaxID=1794699 RepID=A0A2R4VZE1_THEAF|nr:universal stress protein [Thermodesulfobium acidiphilum]AWB09917.1 Nucleotide-binding universal stress protein, UspA family [Thermodesulfobium acidiphilum]